MEWSRDNDLAMLTYSLSDILKKHNALHRYWILYLERILIQKNRLGKIVNHCSWRSFIVAVRTAAHYGIGATAAILAIILAISNLYVGYLP